MTGFLDLAAKNQKQIFKIAYYIGEKISFNTKLNSGYLAIKDNTVKVLFTNEKVDLDNIYQVYFTKINQLGRTIKINNGTSYVFLLAVHFCIAGCLIFVNTRNTKKLYKILSSKALVSTTAPASTLYYQPK